MGGSSDKLEFGMTMNGIVNTQLSERWRPAIETIRERLNSLNGEERYSFSLWALPEGVRFTAVKLNRWPLVYLRAFGSSTRMTIKIRRETTDGQVQNFALGKGLATVSGDLAPSQLTEEVTSNGRTILVQAQEVFAAEEAVDIFDAYHQWCTVPGSYRQRQVQE